MLRILLIAMAILLIPVKSAEANKHCNTKEIVASHLLKNFQEVPVSIALSYVKNLVQIFASKTGTWTLVVTTPQGISCITGSGENWFLIENPFEPTGSLS